jgi:H(+)-translocating pyrophosphatase
MLSISVKPGPKGDTQSGISPKDPQMVEESNSTALRTLCYIASALSVVGIFALSAIHSQWSNIGTYVMFSLSVCFVVGAITFGLTKWLFRQPTGTPAMNQVCAAIATGANGFFKMQYSRIAIAAVIAGALLFTAYCFRPTGDLETNVYLVAGGTTIAFAAGALCSCLAGYIGLWICIQANIRVASAARRSFSEATRVAIASGTIPALCVVGMVVFGLSALYVLGENYLVGKGDELKISMIMIGYGFGASFVALFAQLGGGIYTKASDVGADLVGKIEQNLDEDDPRNPAVVADLVGDNVGDCAGRGADLFESIAAEIIASMILGSSLIAKNPTIEANYGFIAFPLVIHACDLLISSFGVLVVMLLPESFYDDRDPLKILKIGFFAAEIVSAASFYVICWVLLGPDQGQILRFTGCGWIGIVTCIFSMLIAEYYTDYHYRPVRAIGASSETGHATNIITGLAMGMESCGFPILLVAVALLSAFYLGESTGLVYGGLFGTAVATMGMLSTAVYVLSMDFFGPITDNAGGIVEMAEEPADVREITDALDAVGNTTKAATKGYAIVSACLACFLLFRAFTDEVNMMSGGATLFDTVDISKPEVFIAGLLGGCLVFIFTSMVMRAVGTVAERLVVEVRRQFNEIPGLREGTTPPDYEACVALVTRESLREMIVPGMLVVIFPVALGLIFRGIGTMRPNGGLLGAECVASMLMFATVSGVLMAIFMNNAGGAWDNAKKLVETGAHGGKGSEAHKAAVTGDTVGDPFKDTAGPSLHVLIKLLSTITLCAAPLFIGA